MLTAAETPRFRLNTGHSIPAVGIGCWMGVGRAGEGEHVVRMIKEALELGYRHIDTASNYGNEESVGRAIRDSKISRQDLFITTKLASEDHDKVTIALERSLKRLGVDYIDLFLMHWPQTLLETGRALQPEESPTFVETWKEMEKLLDSGMTRSIGVSNFSIKTLTSLLDQARIVPAVNQVEAHPYLPQHSLLSFCNAHGILITAYSPIGKHTYAKNGDIMRISRSKNVTEAQVLLSWGVQRGTVVIPKSENRERLRNNISLIELTSDEMHTLDVLHQGAGMHRSVCGFHSPQLGGSCFGWTYEQLGWDMIAGGVMKAPQLLGVDHQKEDPNRKSDDTAVP